MEWGAAGGDLRLDAKIVEIEAISEDRDARCVSPGSEVDGIKGCKAWWKLCPILRLWPSLLRVQPVRGEQTPPQDRHRCSRIDFNLETIIQQNIDTTHQIMEKILPHRAL